MPTLRLFRPSTPTGNRFRRRAREIRGEIDAAVRQGKSPVVVAALLEAERHYLELARVADGMAR